jgi:uncharacterized membrane protein
MARDLGVRRREENEVEFSRIVAFSDGVFSIAITLLVLNLSIAKGLADDEIAGALWDERQSLFAFAISFAVIGRFWLVHHRFFGEITGFDGRLVRLNLFYLAWIVLLPFSTEVIGEYGGETAPVVLYSANLCGVILIGLAMSSHAARTGLTSMDAVERREGNIRALYIAGVFAISIPIAFVVPELAAFLWLVLFFDPSGRIAARQPG